MRLPYMTDLERVNAENKGYPMPERKCTQRIRYPPLWLKLLHMVVPGLAEKIWRIYQ